MKNKLDAKILERALPEIDQLIVQADWIGALNQKTKASLTTLSRTNGAHSVAQCKEFLEAQRNDLINQFDEQAETPEGFSNLKADSRLQLLWRAKFLKDPITGEAFKV